MTGVPTGTSGGWANRIRCSLAPEWTWNERATSGAVAKPRLPPCAAVIMQTPAATVITVRPDTVHTVGVLEVNDTGSPEVADAATMTGVPTGTSGGWAKKIVCGCFP